MYQDLIVFTVIGITVSFTIYSFVKSLREKKISSGCGGCTGCELSKQNIGCENKQ